MIRKIKFHLGRAIFKLLNNYNKFGSRFESIETSNSTTFYNSSKGEHVKIYGKYKIYNSKIGSYTYIADNASLKNTEVGKFCSIGPNLVSGWGIHPTNGISTAPMFYSTQKQNGISLTKEDKIVEMKSITIGNDVFIGMNVTILDGVTIGNGAVIGAGAVVSKDISPYAIAVGNPIKILKYRFGEDQINVLQQLEWWNWSEEDLPKIEKHFFNIDDFLDKYKEQ